MTDGDAVLTTFGMIGEIWGAGRSGVDFKKTLA